MRHWTTVHVETEGRINVKNTRDAYFPFWYLIIYFPRLEVYSYFPFVPDTKFSFLFFFSPFEKCLGIKKTNMWFMTYI